MILVHLDKVTLTSGVYFVYFQNLNVFVRIFIVHLERSLVPVLKNHLSFWKRYADDTITVIKTGSTEYVLLILNSFHPNIEFTYEKEVNSKLAFLDVLLLRKGKNIITTVYRKVRNSDIYLNWNWLCPQNRERGTLKSLVQRAHKRLTDIAKP